MNRGGGDKSLSAKQPLHVGFEFSNISRRFYQQVTDENDERRVVVSALNPHCNLFNPHRTKNSFSAYCQYGASTITGFVNYIDFVGKRLDDNGEKVHCRKFHLEPGVKLGLPCKMPLKYGNHSYQFIQRVLVITYNL